MISQEELSLARECLDIARACGASACRVTLTKSTENLIATLDGQIDKVTRCADRSMSIAIFADGRFGSFSTNKLESEALRDFIGKATDTVRMLSADEFRRLPDAPRYCTAARSGLEMDLYDEAWNSLGAEDRTRMAKEACVTGKVPHAGLDPASPGYRLISEEGEFSDSEYDTYVLDSQGLECRHCETSFDYGVEVTIEDADGNKYSDYWWTAAPRLKDFDAAACGATAVMRAASQIGSTPAPGGRYKMVVGAECASRLVTPLLNALNANSIQQGNSFLVGSLGKQLFSDGLTILDEPWRKGEAGAKLFDSEGVATKEAPIIENGIVKRYFVNTYMAAKTGMQATSEDAIRPRLCACGGSAKDKEALMALCGSGILVSDFNGGNCNMTTGDFSYGICGQLFENGRIVRPVHEMLVTGNFLQLWKNLVAAGSDFRTCATKLVPSLAFSDVDFSG